MSSRVFGFGAILALAAVAFPSAAVGVCTNQPLYGWTRTFGGTGSDVPQGGITLDGLGNPIVSGNFSGVSDFDPGPASDLRASFNASADCFVSKFGLGGSYQWTLTFGGTGSDQVYRTAFDGSGNLYLCGHIAADTGTVVDLDPTLGSDLRSWVGGQDTYLMRINADGTYGWTGTVGGTGSDSARRVVVDQASNLVYCGVFGMAAGGTLDFDFTAGTDNKTAFGSNDFFVSKVTTSGGYGWTRTGGGTGSEVANSLITDSNNDIIVVGTFAGSSVDFDPTGGTDNRASNNNSTDYFILKLTSTGAYGWARTNGGTGSDTLQDVGVDAANNIYVVGQWGGATGYVWDFDPTGGVDSKTSFGSNDVFVSKFTSAGGYGWTQSFGGTGGENGQRIAVQPTSGNVLLTGSFVGTVDMDPTAGTDLRSSELIDQTNAFVTRLSTNGAYGWSLTMGGTGSDLGYGVAFDGDERMYVTGYTAGSFAVPVDFDPTDGIDYQTSNGELDVFISKYIIDCNTNGVGDCLDVSFGTSTDCNGSLLPDECEAGSWVGADGGSFTIDGNWQSREVPKSTATLTQSGASDNRAVIAQFDTIDLCRLVLGATGAGRQVLEVHPFATLTTSLGVDINAGGTIDLRGGLIAGGPVTNASNTLSGYGEVSGNLINQGLVTSVPLKVLDLTGGILVNESGGTIRAQAGSGLFLGAADLTQEGVLEVRSNATVYAPNSVTNAAGGQMLLLGGTFSCPGLTNHTSANVDGFGTVDGNLTNNGEMTTLHDTQVVGDLTNNGTIFNMSGVLTVIGTLTNNGTIIGQSGSRAGQFGLAIVGDTVMAPGARFVLASGSLKLGGHFDLAVADAGQFDLTTSELQFNGVPGTGPQRLEVAAADVGRRVTLPDVSHFSIRTLRIGPSATAVQLVDAYDNAAGAGPEALYVEELILEPGTTLDLAGHAVYYGRVVPADPYAANSRVTVRDSIGGGRLCRIGATGDGDMNGDCGVTTDDVAGFVAVLLQSETAQDWVVSADLNGDGRANGADIRLFVERLLR